ncbi:MAG: 30S ribosomal protein S17 [bacterium]|nr:30S ribosomal protein S17 [bacterium]
MSKTKIGTIVSDKMQETAIVNITRMAQHPLYQKKYRVSKRFKAHNPKNQYKTGDLVTISEVKPISKDKTWEIVGFANLPKGEKK